MAFAMRSLPVALRSYTVLLATLYSRTAVADIYSGIDHDADPYVIAMSNNASIGPDGPWWYIWQAVSFPDQYLPMLPSVSKSSLVVNASACSTQYATCPLPLPNLWTASGAYKVTYGELTQSDLIGPSAWDEDYAALLGMQGTGRFAIDRITLHRNSDYSDPGFLDGNAMGVSQNFSVNYPGGAEYTMTAGLFSLYGAQSEIDWTAANGTAISKNRTLPLAYLAGYSPSTAYGLHVGSVEPNVTGSLVLGGYDSSRCLTTPIVSSSDSVQLVDIALNVSSGGFAYTNASTAYTPGLLRASGSSVSNLTVHPRPGVPYLYLPGDTCEAIAAHLPVTYNSDFNLYFWNTSEQAYKDIVGSPHYLAFTFSSEDGSNGTISVPFALLNLTLSSPLISSATQYFPCSPFESSSSGYTLGNAFLQAAFLAQNWQTGKLFLAQAPGPDFLSANVQKIAYTDTTITAAKNPPNWQTTWSSTLKALPASASGSTSTHSSSSTGTSSPIPTAKPSSLSGGAIAGIVIGAIVALALVAGLAFFFLRRRKNKSNAPSTTVAAETAQRESSHFLGTGTPGSSAPPQYYSSRVGQPYVADHEVARHEVEAKPAALEMDGGREVGELPGDQPVGGVKYR